MAILVETTTTTSDEPERFSLATRLLQHLPYHGRVPRATNQSGLARRQNTRLHARFRGQPHAHARAAHALAHGHQRRLFPKQEQLAAFERLATRTTTASADRDRAGLAH